MFNSRKEYNDHLAIEMVRIISNIYVRENIISGD
jgi:hypothetical protein